MSNIYEIAQRAGVSPSTVARALKGEGYCKEDTRARVLAVAKELDYRPTHAARALKYKITRQVLFCIPDIYNPFYFDMIRGANDVLDAQGYHLLLCHTKGLVKEEVRMLRSLRERVGDGMILVSFDFTPQNMIHVADCGMPVVLTNIYDDPGGKPNAWDYVYVDTTRAVELLTDHFLERGHRRIGLISGGLARQASRMRVAGYRNALARAGRSVDERLIAEGDFAKESGHAAMARLLAMEEPPTAVIALNDLMAVGAIDACRERGVRIPQDVCLAGIDNTDLSYYVSPPLTTIDMRQEDIGSHAARLLMERIQGRTAPRKMRLEPNLIVRESSGSAIGTAAGREG